MPLFNNWWWRDNPDTYHGMLFGDWKQWIKDVIEAVNKSRARNFVILETDNERATGEPLDRLEVIAEIRKHKPDAIISTIRHYSEDYDWLNGPNHIIALHKGGIKDPAWWRSEIESCRGGKPVDANEVYAGWKGSRAKQKAVLEAIAESAAGFCVDWWEGYNVSLRDTIEDVSTFL